MTQTELMRMNRWCASLKKCGRTGAPTKAERALLRSPQISWPGCLNVTDEVSNAFYLIVVIYDLSMSKLFFNQNRQFDNIEMIETQILVEMCFDTNVLEI